MRAKSGMFLMFFMLIFSPLISAVPMPPQLIMNNATMECAEFYGGDECMACEVPDGWVLSGSGNMTCPEGYAQIDVSARCHPFLSEFCCSEGHSGAPGECSSLAKNDVTKECAFLKNATQGCSVPLGWQKQTREGQWLCPSGYSWTNVSCTAGQNLCPIMLIFPVLGLALFVFKK